MDEWSKKTTGALSLAILNADRKIKLGFPATNQSATKSWVNRKLLVDIPPSPKTRGDYQEENET
jgi:hypothetical protein